MFCKQGNIYVTILNAIIGTPCMFDLHIAMKYNCELESVAKPSVMVALHWFTDAERLWQHAKTLSPWQQSSVEVQFE